MNNSESRYIRRRRWLFTFMIYVALLVVLTGWGRRCEEFNYDIVQWLPYDESDMILISNSTDLDTLTVVSREITHTDRYPVLSCCACINSYSIWLSSTNLDIGAHYFDSRSYVGSIIFINDEDLMFSEYFDTFEINGNVYSDVLEYTNYQEDQSKNFSRLFIARSIGIISIEGADDDWTITDLSIREVDPKKIQAITDGC